MDVHRRRAARVFAVAMALALATAACGTEDGGQAEGDGDEATATGQGPRIAVLLPGNVTDQGFNTTGSMLVNELREEFDADATYTENVSVPNQADVYRQFASQGYDLVIGWGGQFTDGALEVAEEFEDVHFLVASSGADNGANMAGYDTAIEHWQFPVGYLMANLTTTGTVGQISGQCFPSTAANLNGTVAGAEYADPDVRFLRTFTGDFNDPTAARDAAQAMIEQGADVLTTNLNDAQFGVYEAAQAADADVLVIGEWLEDLPRVAPSVLVASSNKTYVPFAVEMVREFVEGDWDGQHRRFDMPASDEWGPAIFTTDLLSDDLYQEAIEIQDEIASGAITVERDENCPS